MKIPTCPDVMRRHQRTCRTYREATGMNAKFEDRRASHWGGLDWTEVLLLIIGCAMTLGLLWL